MPENILIENFSTPPRLKLCDFGSATFEKNTMYTYIQSRFYRAPEVILGLPYNRKIDIWSFGCIMVELYLGLPCFPGVSNHNQLTRIEEMIKPFPQEMLSKGKQTRKFYAKRIEIVQKQEDNLIDQIKEDYFVEDKPLELTEEGEDDDVKMKDAKPQNYVWKLNI